MKERNQTFDGLRLVAALGIVAAHVDALAVTAGGTFVGKFLLPRISLMYFFGLTGYFSQKNFLAGGEQTGKRVLRALRIYVAWSAIYAFLSFVANVLGKKMGPGEFLTTFAGNFLFQGSYYHLWYYPGLIYALLVCLAARKIWGKRAISFLLGLSVVLYLIGALATGYAPLGRQIPIIDGWMQRPWFEGSMRLACIGLPSLVFGMAAAQPGLLRGKGACGLAALLYVGECALLCFGLKWREDPQILLSTPVLLIALLRVASASDLKIPGSSAFRVLSATMFHVHPLIILMLTMVFQNLGGLSIYALTIALSLAAGLVLNKLCRWRIFQWFV